MKKKNHVFHNLLHPDTQFANPLANTLLRAFRFFLIFLLVLFAGFYILSVIFGALGVAGLLGLWVLRSFGLY